VILCPTEQAHRFTGKGVRIAASAMATDSLSIHDRRDPLWLQAAQDSAQRAYRQAGVGRPTLTCLSCTTLSPLWAPSASKPPLCRAGQGLAIGRRRRNPARRVHSYLHDGRPEGARTSGRRTGVYQLVEAAQQLRGEAGDCQVPNARRAMTQNIGGSGATIVTHILEA